MPFEYKHVLAIGSTAGIGRALAARFVESGTKVTVVGRRKERLDEFVKHQGDAQAKGVQFDIGRIDEIPDFATRCIAFHLYMRAKATSPVCMTATDATGRKQCDGGITRY